MDSSKEALHNYTKEVYKKCVPERKRMRMRKQQQEQQEQQYLALRTEPTISFWTTGEIHNAEPSKTHCFLDSFRDVPAIAA